MGVHEQATGIPTAIGIRQAAENSFDWRVDLALHRWRSDTGQQTVMDHWPGNSHAALCARSDLKDSMETLTENLGLSLGTETQHGEGAQGIL